jgi:hypothetical protein
MKVLIFYVYLYNKFGINLSITDPQSINLILKLKSNIYYYLLVDHKIANNHKVNQLVLSPFDKNIY